MTAEDQPDDPVQPPPRSPDPLGILDPPDKKGFWRRLMDVFDILPW